MVGEQSDSVENLTEAAVGDRGARDDVLTGTA